MLSIAGRHSRPSVAGLILLSAVGCQSIERNHATKHIPERGVIDPAQPRELQKVPYPPYVIEPPDELDIAVKPAVLDGVPASYVVQSDGFVDLGFAGSVFVAGGTLADAEQRIAEHLAGLKSPAPIEAREPYQVSVRLTTNQSKYFYVIGAVGTPGRIKCTGNETVLDAILQAGLRSHSLPEKAYLVRPHFPGGPDQVLKIDWEGIKDRGDTLTNYQIMPGDRVVVPGTKPPGLLKTLLGN